MNIYFHLAFIVLSFLFALIAAIGEKNALVKFIAALMIWFTVFEAIGWIFYLFYLGFTH